MRNKQAKINYSDLWGLREEKYKFLEENDVKSTKWQELQPKGPFHFFVIKDFVSEKEYNEFIPLSEVFDKSSSGIKTHRDHFIIGFIDEEIKSRLRTFISDIDDHLISEGLNLHDTRDWKLNKARDILRRDGIINNNFYNYLWRPFDFRRIYYSKILIELPRLEVVGQMIQGSNLAICLSRKIDKGTWDDILATTLLADVHSSSGQTYIFPLYLYGDKVVGTLFENELNQKRLNLKVELLALLNKAYSPQPVTTPLDQQKTFDVSPEQVFNYIYAILYSNTYRLKYQEFLKIDFPRIPFTKDYNLFKELAELGEQLVNLHLLKSPELNTPISKFHGDNGNLVEKREYNEKEKRVCINNQQYFDNIDSTVWNYFIGGYQVLDKWLKDRKGRALSSEDIKHYCKVVSVLSRTIELQKSIDELYPRIEKNLI